LLSWRKQVVGDIFDENALALVEMSSASGW